MTSSIRKLPRRSKNKVKKIKSTKPTKPTKPTQPVEQPDVVEQSSAVEPTQPVEQSSAVEQPDVVEQSSAVEPTQPAEQPDVVDTETKKRLYNIKPTSLETTGICIGPARVRSILINKSLNPREHYVRNAIIQAENKPTKPKPTKQNPNPQIPEQGPQVAVEDLAADVVSVIEEANALHNNNIRDSYEKKVLKNMTAKKRESYISARKDAQVTARNTNTKFDLESFNKQYDPKFYKGFKKFIKENDTYILNKKDSKGNVKYNQWSRAIALVNKLSIRLSGNTRYIVASFLDNIVEQYAYNGIHNCICDNKHMVMIRHALKQSDGFNKRVVLDRFIKTFDNYDKTLRWVFECEQIKKQNSEDKTEKLAMPVYYESEYDSDFHRYVGEICRSVKMRLANGCSDEQKKEQYLGTSVSSEFKKFCSYVIYEAILRIGSLLQITVKRDNVKTVSDNMVWYALEQIHKTTGIDFSTTKSLMENRLAKFYSWCQKRKEARQQKSEANC